MKIETRVNATEEGYEYMTNYLTMAKQVGRLENALGWYHSHPGYGCWLSGLFLLKRRKMKNEI